MQLTANKTSYVAQQLIEGVVYMFSVRARTSVDWGKPTYGNVTIGPRPGLSTSLMLLLCELKVNAKLFELAYKVKR